MTAFSPVTESRIRDIQGRAADRAAKREAAEQNVDAETRVSVSPNDVLAREQHIAACKYWQAIYLQNEARERQEKIREANPTLIKLKAEWGVSTRTVRRLFANTPGVLKLGTKGKHISLRIPGRLLKAYHTKLSALRVSHGVRITKSGGR